MDADTTIPPTHVTVIRERRGFGGFTLGARTQRLLLLVGALIVLGLLAAGMVPLAGCGRVGPLELPPGVSLDQAPNAKRAMGPDGTPVQPVVRKPLPIDVLLN